MSSGDHAQQAGEQAGGGGGVGSGELTEPQVRRLALLARLELTDAQVVTYQRDLGRILGYVERLRQLDLSGVEPMYNPLEALRTGTGHAGADVVQDGLPTERLIEMAPKSVPPYVVVPKVIGE